MVCVRLAKSGYGSLNEVEQWDSEKVLTLLEYEGFIKTLDEAFHDLNKEK